MSTILYADDDENDVFFLERALVVAEIANSLQVVGTGEEVMAYLSGRGIYADRARFPLPFWVFLDQNLPQVRGMDLVKWIRSQPALDQVFVVMLTGSESEREMCEVLNLGANGCLFKPPKPNKIREMVERYLAFARERGVEPEIKKAKG